MLDRSIIFGLFVGLLVISLGGAMLMIAPVGWSLCAVGAGIVVLNLLSWLQTRTSTGHRHEMAYQPLISNSPSPNS